MTQKAQINREHKATLFAVIFSEAEDALSLYNAMNGTDYDDPDLLEFNTIKNVIYIGMKNDVSFLIGTDMNLYEAQSTWNPNMPLRGLFYLAELYKGYVNTNNLDIYSSVQLRLPQPRYVVFYNGPSGQPDVQDLRLSASFVGGEGRAAGLSGRTEAISDSAEEISGHAAGISDHTAGLTGREPALECIAHVVNINYGHNQELMGKCRKLWEYAYLIGAIRQNIAEGMTVEEAVDRAVQECIAKGILAELLAKNRAEVTNMILEEYDEEFHIRCEKQLSREEGRAEGRAEGREEGRAEGREEGRAEGRAEGREEGRAEGRVEGRKEGHAEGRAEGSDRKLIAQVVRKLAKGKSPSVIAEELEEELPVIRMICEAAGGCAPEYDCDEIYQKLVELRAASGSARDANP